MCWYCDQGALLLEGAQLLSCVAFKEHCSSVVLHSRRTAPRRSTAPQKLKMRVLVSLNQGAYIAPAYMLASYDGVAGATLFCSDCFSLRLPRATVAQAIVDRPALP